MLKGIYRTLSGKAVTERRMEMVANNIANSLTPGYKASRPMFRVVDDTIPSQSAGEPGKQGNSYTLDSYINFNEAALVESGNRLDVGIEGDGFFVVLLNGKNMYTRNGQFTLNHEKKLVTMDGNPVLGEAGEITIDGGDVKIETDGTIYVDKKYTDKIRIVTFEDKTKLKNYGRSLFVNIDEKPVETTPEKFSLKQGFYEASNVDVIKEMIEMMSTLRAYESYTKVDQFFSDMMSKLINLGRM
ncbi:MAG TPA: flagellar basal-body rod protein FlgF [Syntrophorhabdaceae bacterium]|nr:flagellar basal-body rod protein FlgF [Syntrophorhabdaceae bacterium]HON85639.1 flagellar basal-body rod protein FlgF [Syntrophorhabdaceae bacterium]HOT41948.1 flagellar basal-body rod protein FlgF [Syntrophorhabdaceae bacterium]HPC67036.1 flagellar basal-body rod protein FlgF [Syntrophorhabdaceae bacterium]HPP06541.1 flagellar basal-body rod protein FlgF [Syntrophorhabdaceae bacterium]